MAAGYDQNVDNVALLALVHADPEGPGVDGGWLGEALTEHWAGYRGPRDDDAGWVRAWSVGGVQNGETLVQSRPVVREARADFVADFLRATSQTTLAAFHAGRDETDPVPRLGIARFQRWIGVRAEGDLDDDGAADVVRQRLQGALPDFLHRSVAQQSDRELTVFGFFAALHAHGDLSRPFVTPPQVRRGLAALDELLGHPPRANVLVTDGRTLGVLHRGGRLLLVEPPAPPHRNVRAIAGVPPKTASVLVYDPDAGEPPAGARRLAEGIFTVHVRQPAQVERD